ncbi:Nn.00g088290.m01.CDS01 [Neocucurbitaria sp. VM-36]
MTTDWVCQLQKQLDPSLTAQSMDHTAIQLVLHSMFKPVSWVVVVMTVIVDNQASNRLKVFESPNGSSTFYVEGRPQTVDASSKRKSRGGLVTDWS